MSPGPSTPLGTGVLSCSVRGCGQPLEPDVGRVLSDPPERPAKTARLLRCAAGHTFDIARSGYVNLLQPQDRRSRQPGDSPEAAAARARLFDAGVGRAALDQVASRAAGLEDGAIVDIGCGVGDALSMLARRVQKDPPHKGAGRVRKDPPHEGVGRVLSDPARRVGIDLSTAAIELAARRHPGLTWVVANADRRIPVLDGQAVLVMSLNGRRNPPEVSRILRPQGRLLVTVPAPDDVIELRALVQGAAVERSRADAVLAEHAPLFDLLEQTRVREQATLDPPLLADLLRGTYRGLRASETPRVNELTRMTITLASELFVFQRR